ncbi:MAG: hypothetical protein RLZZ262_310 [Bacteroidota bacterium]
MRILIITFLVQLSQILLGQIVIDNSVNAVDGLQNVLLGSGISVANITTVGTNQQFGSFTCSGTCGLGLTTGFVMATGNVDQIVGNNELDASQGPASGFASNDADLELMTGETFNDVAVLEFDFVPNGNFLLFNFVFGSEEYPEFVNSGYNDAFGFFLSGPGISGPYSNNSINLALVPNSTSPISVDAINSVSNSQYYIPNTILGPSYVEPDGYTTVMQASSPVECFQTYHIKLVIADVQDVYYDSYVFLEGGSFVAQGIALAFTAPTIAPNSQGLYEGCLPGMIEAQLPASLLEDSSYEIIVSGSAQQGTDVSWSTDTIVFPANTTSLSIPISGFTDAIIEGGETFIITANSLDGCGSTAQTTVEIHDPPILEVTNGIHPFVCGEEVTITPDISGGYGYYNITWNTGSNASQLILQPTGNISYSYTATDTCGLTSTNAIHSLLLWPNPNWTIEPLSDTMVNCNSIIQHSAISNGNLADLSYSWLHNGIEISTNSSISFNAQEDAEVILIVTDECGFQLADTFYVALTNAPLTAEIQPEGSFDCVETITLEGQPMGGTLPYTFLWSDGAGTSLGSANTITYTIDESNWVILMVEDNCGVQALDSVWFEMTNEIPQFSLGPDLNVTCLESIQLLPTIIGNTTGLQYQWYVNNVLVSTDVFLDLIIQENTTVSLIIENSCGATVSDELEIFLQNPNFDVTIVPDVLDLCANSGQFEAAIIGGTSPFIYEWYANAVDYANTPTVTLVTNEEVTLVIVVTDGCGMEATDTYTVSPVNPPLDVQIQPDGPTSCVQDIILEAQAIGGSSPYSYSWIDSMGSILGTTTTLNHSITESEWIYLLIEDNCGELANDSIWLETSSPIPTINLGPDQTVPCLESVPLAPDIIGDSTNLLYEWYVNNTLVSTADNFDITVQEAITITLVVENECGQTASDEIIVQTQNLPLSVDLGPDQMGECIYAGQFEPQITGGTGPFEYNWLVNNLLTYTTSTVSVETNEAMALTVVVTDACQQTAEDEVNILLDPPPLILIPSPDVWVCFEDSADIWVEVNAYDNQWQGQWQPINSSSDTIRIAITDAASYTFTVEDLCGQTASVTINVGVISIEAEFSWEYAGDYTISFENLSDSSIFSHWEFSDGTISNDYNPTHTFSNGENMEATLFVQSGGCEASSSDGFLPPGTLYIPNCFTADNDGINDVIFAQGTHLVWFEWKIFNRWGEKIFETDNLDEPWVGSHLQGSYYCPDGVYVYTAKAIDLRGNYFDYQGTITLIR